ncbi:hypothetical protein CCR75_006165 [Bremia lactucae]|uniref:Uncharacterized protein n=1 Tax=Bremia lactucae TaxID=4779 RepID=A0A976NZC7_BRELC|nr:hypothetical protein CCR75_006165 [Bremia lactucae]
MKANIWKQTMWTDDGNSDQVMDAVSDLSSSHLDLLLQQAVTDVALRSSPTTAAAADDMQLNVLPTHAPTVHCHDYD